MNISKKDLKIICNLRQNSRESLTSLSKKVKMPISTIYDRLRTHQGKLIQRHTTLIDFSELGYFARAHVAIKVPKEHRNQVREHLKNIHCINNVFRITNSFDFLIEGIFKNVKELEDFVESLEEQFPIQEKHVYYIIDDIKQEAFLADPISLELACRSEQN